MGSVFPSVPILIPVAISSANGNTASTPGPAASRQVHVRLQYFFFRSYPIIHKPEEHPSPLIILVLKRR
jgi:hypothetical protein